MKIGEDTARNHQPSQEFFSTTIKADCYHSQVADTFPPLTRESPDPAHPPPTKISTFPPSLKVPLKPAALSPRKLPRARVIANLGPGASRAWARVMPAVFFAVSSARLVKASDSTPTLLSRDGGLYPIQNSAKTSMGIYWINSKKALSTISEQAGASSRTLSGCWKRMCIAINRVDAAGS